MKIFLLFTILSIALYIYYAYPRKINETYHGIQYKLGDSEHKEDVTIKINGWITKKLILKDRFEGAIVINEKEISKLKLDIDNSREWLLGYNKEISEFESFGAIYIKGIFEEFTICVFEKGEESGSSGWSSKDGFMISVPAKSRDEALEISQKLVKNDLIKPLQ